MQAKADSFDEEIRAASDYQPQVQQQQPMEDNWASWDDPPAANAYATEQPASATAAEGGDDWAAFDNTNNEESAEVEPEPEAAIEAEPVEAQEPVEYNYDEMRQVYVLYNFDAQNGDELTITENELVWVTNEECDEEGWAVCINSEGTKGFVPLNYLDFGDQEAQPEVAAEQPEEVANPVESAPSQTMGYGKPPGDDDWGFPGMGAQDSQPQAPSQPTMPAQPPPWQASFDGMENSSEEEDSSEDEEEATDAMPPPPDIPPPLPDCPPPIHDFSKSASISIDGSLSTFATDYCTGMYDYDATGSDEISFKAGDKIKILNRIPNGVDDGWWKGIVKSGGNAGKTGLFPSIICEPLSDSESEEGQTDDSIESPTSSCAPPPISPPKTPSIMPPRPPNNPPGMSLDPMEIVVTAPTPTVLSPVDSEPPERPSNPPAQPPRPADPPAQPPRPAGPPPAQPPRPTEPPAQPARPTEPPAQPARPTGPPAQPPRPVESPAQPPRPVDPPAQPPRPTGPPPPQPPRPAESSEKPVDPPAQPIPQVEPSKPVVEPPKTVVEPPKTVVEPPKTVVEPPKPVVRPPEIVMDSPPSSPEVSEPNEPIKEPIEPIKEPIEPIKEPIEPIKEPIEAKESLDSSPSSEAIDFSAKGVIVQDPDDPFGSVTASGDVNTASKNEDNWAFPMDDPIEPQKAEPIQFTPVHSVIKPTIPQISIQQSSSESETGGQAETEIASSPEEDSKPPETNQKTKPDIRRLDSSDYSDGSEKDETESYASAQPPPSQIQTKSANENTAKTASKSIEASQNNPDSNARQLKRVDTADSSSSDSASDSSAEGPEAVEASEATAAKSDDDTDSSDHVPPEDLHVKQLKKLDTLKESSA